MGEMEDIKPVYIQFKRPRGRPRKNPPAELQLIENILAPLGTEFTGIVKKACRILAERDAKYSGNDVFSNFESSEKLGLPKWLSVMNRMEDKISRAENQAKLRMKDIDPGDLEDTLIDLANYALIAAYFYHQETFKKT